MYYGYGYFDSSIMSHSLVYSVVSSVIHRFTQDCLFFLPLISGLYLKAVVFHSSQWVIVMFFSSDEDKNGLLLHTLQSSSEDSEVILCESRRKMRTLRGLDRIVAHSPVSLKKLNRRAHCPKGTLSYSDDTPNTMTRLWLAHPDIRTWERWTLIGPLMTKIELKENTQRFLCDYLFSIAFYCYFSHDIFLMKRYRFM